MRRSRATAEARQRDPSHDRPPYSLALPLLRARPGAAARWLFAWRSYTQPLPLPRRRSLSTFGRLHAVAPSRATLAPPACCRIRSRSSRSPACAASTATSRPAATRSKRGSRCRASCQAYARRRHADLASRSSKARRSAICGARSRASADVKNTALDLPDAELMAQLGASPGASGGDVLSRHVFLRGGQPDVAMLDRARKAMAARLDAAWQQRATDLPLATPYEALILASIVEKETGRRWTVR